MPIPSPFHLRTFDLCDTYRFKDWAGRVAVCAYDVNVEREYFALRHTAGMIDVSPLYKYDLEGPDAAATLAMMATRNVARLRVGRVGYTCWCDDSGMVIDDGTVTRLSKHRFRLTAAEPSLYWLHKMAHGRYVQIRDRSEDLAAVAVQGPESRAVVAGALGEELNAIKYFTASRFEARGFERGDLRGWVTRTGFTGDLGYEIWVDAERALDLWDRLAEVGEKHGLQPAGLDALDISRVEAGYLLHGIDYRGAHEEVRKDQLSTPFELGWDWMVNFDRGPFVGREALLKLRSKPRLRLVGLTLDFSSLVDLYAEYDLPPHLPTAASREPLPIYNSAGRQVGQITSHTWSPLLKRSLALASVNPPYSEPGTQLQVEHTVDYDRRKVPATVTALPFYNPSHKTGSHLTSGAKP